MAVNTTHEEYDKAAKSWRKARDFSEGADSVKRAGTRYLPKLSKQTDEDYEAYKDRAMFFNATGRTIEALKGSIFRKDPVANAVDDVLHDDVDLNGSSLTDFAKHITNEVLTTGRFGVLTDWSDEENRAYLSGYTAEDIINWRVERQNGKMVLSLVVLKEENDKASDVDEFDVETVTQYRVLRLTDGQYTVQVYEESADGSLADVPGELITPRHNGEPFNEIPFQFYGSMNNDGAVDKPPLMDLINVNLSHYHNSADLEHGRHYTGLPTPIATGFDFDENNPLVLGSKEAWVSNVIGASAFFLEFTGSGLSTLERALKDKEQLMAIMGAKVLESPRTGVEAAETARIRQAGEVSVLATTANAISDGLTNNLRWAMQWSGMKDTTDVSIKLNTDYIDLRMSSSELLEYIAAYQSGGISFDTLFSLLLRGEIYNQGVDKDEERARIESEGVAPSA